MASRKKSKSYRVYWSVEADNDSFDVDASDVEGMTEKQRQVYFQQCVDEEAKMRGPAAFVDSVDEIDED